MNMETLYASPFGFPRDVKPVQYRPSVSAISSPSAKSSSSAELQDDLLPELWLESPPLENYSFLNPVPVGLLNSGPPGLLGSAQPRIAVQQNTTFSPNFLMNHVPAFQDASNTNSFHSSCLLRDESLEYAQLLLPHSLLFPVTGGRRTSFESARHVHHAPSANDAFVNMGTEHAFSHLEHPRPASLRRTSSFSSMNSRHGSASSAGSLCSVSSVSSTKSQGKNLNTQLYKTELCASFMKLGVCPYGGKCQFAHGASELKSVERPSNWRLKPCANWARSGSCRYGKRCCFRHGD